MATSSWLGKKKTYLDELAESESEVSTASGGITSDGGQRTTGQDSPTRRRLEGGKRQHNGIYLQSPRNRRTGMMESTRCRKRYSKMMPTKPSLT